MLKKILILVCACMFILTMMACDSTEEDEDVGAIEAKPWAVAIDYGYPDEMESTDATEATVTPTEAPTEAPTEPPTEAPTEAPTEKSELQVTDKGNGKTEMRDKDGNIIIVEDTPTQSVEGDSGSSGKSSSSSSSDGKNDKPVAAQKNTEPTTKKGK